MTLITAGLYSNYQADKRGGLKQGEAKGINDQYDAYRHALFSAMLTIRFGEAYARSVTEDHEVNDPNTAEESNMDRWNNDVGVQIGLSIQPDEDLAQKVYDAVRIGITINDPMNDSRRYGIDPITIDLDYSAPEFNREGRGAYDQIDDKVSTDFNRAIGWQPPRDPLALDLDGDGVETTPADGNILFDHDADGLKTGTGWLSADDAWLVHDLDGNGTIDSGRELFGVDTQVPGGTATDGFAAARMLDSNADGVLSADDTAWSELKLWRDLNQDGLSQAGELQSLAAHGIASIGLSATLQNRDLGNGNVILYGGEYTRTDGSTGLANAHNLGQDTFHSEYVDPLPVSEAAAALPDMQGSGHVRSLREAMSQSPQLLELVQRFVQAASSTEQAALAGQIALAWGETSPLQAEAVKRSPDFGNWRRPAVLVATGR